MIVQTLQHGRECAWTDMPGFCVLTTDRPFAKTKSSAERNNGVDQLDINGNLLNVSFAKNISISHWVELLQRPEEDTHLTLLSNPLKRRTSYAFLQGKKNIYYCAAIEKCTVSLTPSSLPKLVLSKRPSHV